MTHYTFPEERVRAKKVGKCPVCKKRVVRTQVFYATVNPFNRHPDGTLLTAREVRQQAQDEADAWVPDFLHRDCVEAEAVWQTLIA